MKGRRFLLRLYPPGWRQRYREELDAVLDDLGPHGGRVHLDLIRGAIDAQLHRRRYRTMSASPPPRWPAWALVVGSAAVGSLVLFTLRRYPGNVHDRAAPVYLVMLAVVLAGYFGCAGWGMRRRLAGRASGVLFGSVAGVLWSVEIWAGGPAMLSRATEEAVGATFAMLAVGVTVAAGVCVGARDHDRGAAIRAGLFAGLTSGVVVFLAGTVMTLVTLNTLATRTDYQRQFADSHGTDMATFLTGDILAAVTAHLVINLVLGLVGGCIGMLVTGPSDRKPEAPTHPSARAWRRLTHR